MIEEHKDTHTVRTHADLEPVSEVLTEPNIVKEIESKLQLSILYEHGSKSLQ